MNKIPDVLGFLLKDALNILEKNNMEAIIVETYKKEGHILKEARVVQQKKKSNKKLQLTIAYF